MKTRKSGVVSLFLAALLLCLTVFPASAAETVESVTAATVQLMKTEGTVKVTNASERSLTVRDNMRLYNGYSVETMAESFAWINLDDKKLTKLDSVSEVELRKDGRVLEMLLSSGNLYFNVTSPLESDEVLNIRTSTMAVGIRGTCGWVKVIDRWYTEIYILEGTVQISVADPVTGARKTSTLRGGEKAVAAVYPQEQLGDRCEIIQDRFGRDDIDGFVLAELVQDTGLCGNIYDDSGIDVLPPMGALESVRRQLDGIREELADIRERLDGGSLSAEDAQRQLDGLRERMEDVKSRLEGLDPQDDARRRLNEAQEHLQQARESLDGGSAQDALGRLDDAREDLEGARQIQADDARQKAAETVRQRLGQEQQEMRDKLDSINEQLAGQDNNISSEPVWQGGGSGAPGNSSTPSGSGRPSGTPGSSVTLTMPVDTEQLQENLDKDGVTQVNVQPGGDPDGTLTLDIPITVPEGKTLQLDDGIDTVIEEAASLTVDGTVTGEGTLTNDGELTVDGTLEMGLIMNSGVLRVTDVGRIAAIALATNNRLESAGTLECRVIQIEGSTVISGGTVTNGYLLETTNGKAELTLSGGTVTGVTGPALELSGDNGTVTFSGAVLQATQTDVISGGLIPDGYVLTGPDGQGRYTLSEQ